MNPFLLVLATAVVIAILCAQCFVPDKTLRVVLILLAVAAAILALIHHNSRIYAIAPTIPDRFTGAPHAPIPATDTLSPSERFVFAPTPPPASRPVPTPDAAKARAEILRKYGAQPAR